VSDSRLDGARILVLEDEFLIAMDVEQLCRDHGAAEVSVLRRVEEAEAGQFETRRFDVAIVDLMLGGSSSLPLASKLRDHGVPLVFASGYPGLDQELSAFPGVQILAKPYLSGDLVSAVAQAMRPTATVPSDRD
jgi:DNA-binding response OmpR family regulator